MNVFGLQISRAARFSDSSPPRRMEPILSGRALAISGSASPDPAVFDVGWTGTTASRGLPRVTPERAVQHATVFGCCNNIAGDLSKVPLKLWLRRGDGQEDRVREHPAGYLLNVESSSGVPARLMRYALVYAWALRGNGHAYAPRTGAGELASVEAVRQGSVSMLSSGAARYYDFEDLTGVRRRVAAGSMMHLRYMAEDGWTGRSPLSVAAESVGLALAGQSAAARTANGGSTKGVIKLADEFENEDDRARYARGIREHFADGTGWAVVGAGDDVKALDLSAADQELLASRKFDREQLAAIYRMPPSKLQMLEHGVKANGEQQAIDYLTDCLLHWSALAEAQMQLAVLTRAEREAGFFLRHDFGALLQPTVKDQFDALTKAVGGPIMTPNEGRAIRGLGPVDGGEKLNPAPNMTRPAGDAALDGDDTGDDDDE